ncbi:MAG: DevR family CRISPR-associated autoregulator [Zestosphaera sp.]
MVFTSIGLRLRVEVEALNMVEALGAYTRHRTASVFKKLTKEGTVVYKLITAPAISGQSIANGYMRTLVELAKHHQLSVCDECRAYEARGGFTKHGTTKEAKYDDLVKGCVIEDLTGFMVPEANLRRTSPVMFSYMVPDLESAKAEIDSQFHVRYDFTTQEHQPFNIESGTAVYMVMIGIDVLKIGRLGNGSYVSDRNNRIEIALHGIAALFEGFGFGALKGRDQPIEEVVEGRAAVSSPVQSMESPPRIYTDGDNYLTDTIRRASKYVEALKQLGEKISIAYFDKEGLKPIKETKQELEIVETNTLTDLIEKTLTKIYEYIEKTQTQRPTP